MTNQYYWPAYTGDILYPMRVSLFIALLLMGYVLSRPQTTNIKEEDILSAGATREWESLPAWQRKSSDRAVERYTSSQEKKWRRWNEAMFERSD